MKLFSKFARCGVLAAALASVPVFAQSGNPQVPNSAPVPPNGGAAAPTAGGSQTPDGRANREPYRDNPDPTGGPTHNLGWLGLLGLLGLAGLFRRDRTGNDITSRP